MNWRLLMKPSSYALIVVLLLTYLLPQGLLQPQIAYANPNDVALPPPTEWAAPSGAPAVPGDAFGVTFTSPPVSVAANAPVIAEWTKTAKTNESFTMTGIRFTTQSGSAAGSDTTVWVWADTPGGGVLTKAQTISVTDTVLQAIVPASVPFGMYLIWVENSNGASSPIALNRPEPTWMGPFGNKAAPGSSKRLFGKNLSKNHGTANAYVYLQPSAGGAFTAAAVTSVEPYAVQFTVPSSLTAGNYNVYLHSGHGGSYGWSSPLTLTVAADWARGTTETVVAPLGGGADDTDNIQAAINAQSANANGGTVRLQAGTYRLGKMISLTDNVRLLGAGKTSTILNIDPLNQFPTGIMIIGAHTMLEAFTITQKTGPNQPQYGQIKTNFPGPYADIRIKNLIINADAGTKGGTIDIRTSGGEISGSDFYRELTMSGSDFWVHDNNFYGGPYGGAQVNETEAATYTDGDNLLMEHNHFETQNWPVNTANGSKNYLDFVPANDLQYKVWAKRVFYTAPQFTSVENSYIAWNTGTNVAVDDNRGELILYHGISSKVYAQVASNSGTTLTINTSGLIDGQARNVDNMPAISNVPSNIVHGQLDGEAYVVIVNGTGMGQARKIVSHTSTMITVDKPWRVPPAADSKITLTFLSKDPIVYKNNIDAFPSGYNLFYSASTGPDADGNAFGFAAEGNITNRTYGGRVLGGYSTGPGYWNEQRDEVANNAVHSGMNIVAWAFDGYDFLGPSVLGTYFRGGSATVTSAQNGAASGPPALLNSQISPYEGQEIVANRNAIVASGFEGVTGSGSTLGARADQWTQVLFRNNTLTVQNNANVSYSARPVEIRKYSDPYFFSNSYTGATPIYVKTNASTLADRPTPMYRTALFQGAVGSSPASQTIPIANTGISSLSWSVSASQPWISASVQSGTSPVAAEQQSGQLNLSVNTSGLAAGTYNGTVTISSGGGLTATVGVKLILGSGGGGGGDTQAPSAPTNLASPSKTSNSVTLTWTASTDNVGVTGYDIYRGATLAGAVNGSTTTFTDTGLSASTSYTYTVKAKDAALNVSAASNAVTVTTNAGSDTQAPTAPTNLASPSKTSSSVTLTWTASTDNVGVTGYDIYRGATLAGTVNGSTTTFTDTGLTASTSYSYTVKAKDAALNVSAASNTVTVTTNAGSDTQAPTAPTNLASPSKTSNSVTLTWTASTDNVGVTGYDVYRGSTLAGSVNGSTTTFTDTGLTASTSYTYTVKAKDAANNASSASNAVTVTTDPASGGTGTGLTGEYYNNIDFVGLRNTRVDAQINFDWGTSIPSGINLDASDTYSVRWIGQIEAPATGTYTFTTTSDDGVKVWVNGTMIIDHYSDHTPTDRSGTISLTAGTKYDIKIEYYNNQPNAVIKLYWAYPGQSQQLVPQSRLYP